MFLNTADKRFSRLLVRILPACLLIAIHVAVSLPKVRAQIPSPSSIPIIGPVSESDVLSDVGLDTIENQIRNEHYSIAISMLRPFVETQPTSWRAHYDLGFALFRVRGGRTSLQENLRESIRELARSLELNEHNSDAHRILGLDLMMIQREELAGVEFAEAVRLKPSSAENHYFLGRHFMLQSQYSSAEGELREATKIDPTYTKAFENLGITLDRLGSADEALECLKRAVELDEKQVLRSEWPYLDLASFYRTRGNTAAALPLAIVAANLNPRSEEAFVELGLLYRAERNWPLALESLQKAANLNPNAAETQYLLGRTYRALGDLPRSHQAFENFDKLRKLNEIVPVTPTEGLEREETTRGTDYPKGA